MWLSPWMAAGSCGWATDASGSTGGGCGAAGRTAPAGAPRGCQPHCWSPALSETVMCLNLIRHSDPAVSQCRVKLKSLITWKVGEGGDLLCAMAMTPDRGMMRFCVCWWLWWELWMFVNVLTGGSPPPEPEIWRENREMKLHSHFIALLFVFSRI